MAKVFDFPQGKHPKKLPDQGLNSVVQTGRRPATVLTLRPKLPDLALPTFETFGQHMQAGDLAAAGELLSYLLGVSQAQGMEACTCYQQLIRQDSQAGELLTQLIAAIEQVAAEPCLLLLGTCFGMVEPRSVQVWEHLSSQTHLKDIPS